MNRRAILFAALSISLGGALYFGWALPKQRTSRAEPRHDGPRIASLSPAVTDTILALGARSSLALVSDYCRTSDLPRAGTIISPRFERIAAERPSLILATRVAGSPDQDLMRLGPLLVLPWLSLEEVTDSVRRVGIAVDREQEGQLLAARMSEELRDRTEDSAPRVLLLMGPLSEERVGYFFIRNESLHGRLLTASGYRNAMGMRSPPGQPRLSVEQLLKADPEAVLVLQEAPASGEVPLESLTPLTAVRTRRTGVLSRPGILSMGPDILEIRSLVEDALDRMFEETRP